MVVWNRVARSPLSWVVCTMMSCGAVEDADHHIFREGMGFDASSKIDLLMPTAFYYEPQSLLFLWRFDALTLSTWHGYVLKAHRGSRA